MINGNTKVMIAVDSILDTSLEEGMGTTRLDKHLSIVLHLHMEIFCFSFIVEKHRVLDAQLSMILACAC